MQPYPSDIFSLHSVRFVFQKTKWRLWDVWHFPLHSIFLVSFWLLAYCGLPSDLCNHLSLHTFVICFYFRNCSVSRWGFLASRFFDFRKSHKVQFCLFSATASWWQSFLLVPYVKNIVLKIAISFSFIYYNFQLAFIALIFSICKGNLSINSLFSVWKSFWFSGYWERLVQELVWETDLAGVSISTVKSMPGIVFQEKTMSPDTEWMFMEFRHKLVNCSLWDKQSRCL